MSHGYSPISGAVILIAILAYSVEHQSLLQDLLYIAHELEPIEDESTDNFPPELVPLPKKSQDGDMKTHSLPPKHPHPNPKPHPYSVTVWDLATGCNFDSLSIESLVTL